MATFRSSFFFMLLITLTYPYRSSSDPFLRRSIKAQTSGGTVQPLWCVAKNNAQDSALEQALNWACGAGGADCGPIQPSGSCYDPNDLLGMASYAFNNYCVKNGMTDDACNFSSTAALTSLDPSHDGCKFPSSSMSVVNSTGSSTASGMDTGSIADTSSSSSSEVLTPFLAIFFILLVIPAAIDVR